jgi:hypothetical protein
VDGIVALQARVSVIEARLGIRNADPTAGTGTAASTSPSGVGADGASDFSRLLDQAIASASAAAATTTGPAVSAPTLRPLGASTIGAPSSATAAAGDASPAVAAADVDLSAYANGQIPSSALSPIGDGEYLAAPAARAFTALRAAAARDGVTMGVNDAYRSLEDQERLAAQLGLYSQGGLAARPGTSTHGLGVSLDLDLDGAAQRWMQANAGAYGFVADVGGESWHWTYRPANA